MRKYLAGLLLALSSALPGWTAERLKSDPEDLNYLQNNRAAAVLQWEHPHYPPEPGADWVRQAVQVEFEVDVEGRVIDARMLDGAEKYAAAAVEAVSRWKFQPEIVDGKPALASKKVRLTFTPKGTPKKTERDEFWCPYEIESPSPTPPGEPADADVLYPAALMSRRLWGEVELILGINPEGRVDGVEILRAPHPEFLSAALQTVAGWKLPPARIGRVPQVGRKRAVLTFLPVDEEGRLVRAEWLERNGIFLQEPPGAGATAYFDSIPIAAVMVDPVYPHAHATAGTTGGARVHFNVTADGQVTNVRIDEATAPEFGESVAAAIASWQFLPLRKDGKDCWADFGMTWRFKPHPADSVERRLLDSLGTENQPANARLLDRPLAPLFLRPAVYPAALRDTAEAGEARIEVIIDRDGRVRLPHIRMASRPEFGWAAATAVSQWLFETPRINGHPVDVRVVIPVNFKAPDPASSGG